MDLSCQAAAFADHVASGALTSEFAAERQQLEGRVERLRAQHTEAVQDKSAAENKSRRLMEKLATAVAEKEDLSRQFAAERKDANRAYTEAQAAQARSNLRVWRPVSLANVLRSWKRASAACAPPGQSGGLYSRKGRPNTCTARGCVPRAWCADRSL
jgi:hypothetical protein